MGDVSGPPSDFARLVLFCDLADQYDDLAVALPVVDMDLQLVPLSPEPAPDHWPRVVRAMALRKFMLTKSDHVYVPTVLDAVERCLTDQSLVQNVEGYREGFRGLGLAIRVDEGSGVPRIAPEIIEDLIYGGLLHGDYDRHRRVRSRPSMTHDVSLWQFTSDAEHFIRQLRGVIRGSIDEGILADGPTRST